MTSPPQPDPDSAIGTAQTLAAALDGMAERLAEVNASSETRDARLTKYGRANRHRIWVTYALLAVDVALTIIVAFLAVQAGNASSRAESATARAAAATAAEAALHTAQVSGCVAGNQERSGELALWTYLFKASKPASKAQAQAIAKFMGLVESTFAPRDCSALYSLTPPKQRGLQSGRHSMPSLS